MVAFLVYLGIGALAGIFAGLLGVGGGLVVVPLLSTYFYYLGFPPEILIHIAIGTSLASMVTTTLFSTWAHHRNGAIIMPTFKLMGGGIMGGSFLGAVIADFIQSTLLSVAFGLFALLVSFQIFFNIEWKPQSKAPNDRVTEGFSIIIGLISSLLGIGAGTLGIPFLLSYRKLSIHQAIGNAAALSLAVSIVGALTFYFTGVNEPNAPSWTSGYIYWPAVLGISIGSPIFAWGSANIAHLLPVIALKRIFAVFLFVVGVRMLFF